MADNEPMNDYDRAQAALSVSLNKGPHLGTDEQKAAFADAMAFVLVDVARSLNCIAANIEGLNNANGVPCG